MNRVQQSVGGKGYIILNIIRTCNIVCLLAGAAAAILMLCKTGRSTSFFFFDGATHLIVALCCIAIALTELPIVQRIKSFRRHLETTWPVLSQSSGFLGLAVFMVIVGITTLGSLNQDAYSKENLGNPIWSCVIASGIINIIFGFFNIPLNYIFQFQGAGISARQTRALGATASQKSSPSSSSAGSTHETAEIKTRRGRASAFFKRQATHASDFLPSYYVARSNDSAPYSHPIRNISAPFNTRAGPSGADMMWPLNTGDLLNASDGAQHKVAIPQATTEDASQGREGGIHVPPVIGGVQRPDLAHHPAYQVRRPTSSLYSQATAVTRSQVRRK